MVYILILAHLLGDYLLQTQRIVRWKSRSLVGVLAHGGIVTVTTLFCATLIDAKFWPYALLIGMTHTVIDVARARYLHPVSSNEELLWYLADQAAHLTVIILITTWSGQSLWRASSVYFGELTASRGLLAYVLGYLLLTTPAWVLLRFIVRGFWGPQEAPQLNQGEKYGPILERLLITTSVLLGQTYLLPLILIPRRLKPVRLQEGDTVALLLRQNDSAIETVLSTLLAVGIGLGLRLIAVRGIF